ncbi:hypothetical protein [Streptomyces sp. NPDC055134]
MTSNENTHRPGPPLEGVPSGPPPEGSDKRKPLRRRIADRWNGLGRTGQAAIGVTAVVVGGVVLSYLRARQVGDTAAVSAPEGHMTTEPLSFDEQEELVVILSTSLETMPEDKFEASYQQLDQDHQWEVDDAIREFANNAVGSDTWDQ